MPCTITVEGDGRGKYGKPKVTKTGPVEDFLVDNSVYYTAVTKHLRQCASCDPEEVLTTYLRRRVQIPKFHGQTSGTLVKTALVYERLPRPASKALVDEVVLRGGIHALLEHEGRLNFEQIAKGLRVSQRAWELQGSRGSHPLSIEGRRGTGPRADMVRTLARIIRDNPAVPDEDLQELVQVADVMLS